MAKAIEIVKPITLEVDGTTYTLEFNRNSVMSAERAGLVIGNVQDMPANTIPLLFYSAFKMHHPNIKRSETDAILETIGGISISVFERLAELYAAPTKALIHSDDEAGNEGKNFKFSL
jgi:hypothetical protein